METFIHDKMIIMVSNLSLSADESYLTIRVYRDDHSLETFSICFDFSGKIIELWAVQMGIIFKVTGDIFLRIPDDREALCTKAVEIAMRTKQFKYYLEHTGRAPNKNIERKIQTPS